jgi:hypothetical protein
MSITNEKMLKNAKKFNETGLKYGVINDDLLELLGAELISAPCTTSDNLYNAYDGGLIQHILNVTKFAIDINNIMPEDKQLDIESIIRVSLMHQIGKAKMFVKQDNEWFVKNRGERFKFNEELLSLNTGERSVYYALKAGINLTEDEVYAIHNSGTDFGGVENMCKAKRLAGLLKTANLAAILAQKN